MAGGNGEVGHQEKVGRVAGEDRGQGLEEIGHGFLDTILGAVGLTREVRRHILS
jgi:hypothetical protein